MIISEMQRKLATWAATDPSLRIQRLLRLITQPEWLAEAARITLSSKGAHTPGVDGVNKTMLQARLAVELQILRDELLSGHYQPVPARRVYIPKSNGKLRPLGIPALRDRISIRAKVEHPFRIIKRQFGFVKARYKGLLKNDNQLAMLFTLANLFRVDQMIRQWERSQ